MRQIAAAIVGVGLALGALGLNDLPLAAWACAIALDALAIMASLALISTGRRDLAVPAVGLAGIVLLAGLLVPAFAAPAPARGAVGVIGCGAFLIAFVLWAEAVERPFA